MQQSLLTHTKVIFKAGAGRPLQRENSRQNQHGQVVTHLPLPGLLLLFAADVSHRLLLPLSAVAPTPHLSLLTPMASLFTHTAVGVGGP